MQLFYFAIFIIILIALLLLLHYIRVKTYNTPYVMFFTFLWFLSFVTGHLNYSLKYDVAGLFILDVRYSSSIYVILFASILLVYICEGVKEGRDFILASIGVHIILILCQFFLGSVTLPILRDNNLIAAMVVFEPTYWKQIVSGIASVIDILFSVFIFQFMVNRFKKISTGILLYFALLLTLFLDSLIFVSLTRMDTFFSTLISHLIFKSVIITFTSIPLVLYVNWFQKKGNLDLDRGSLDIFKKIEKLEAAINIANQKLREYANNLEIMVNDRTFELENAMNELQNTNDELSEARDRLWSEMELAKEIQITLIPQKSFLKEYDISACLIPASEVGGDYYDVINFKTNDWIIIGDVSGHGVSAGLIMMMVQSCIQTLLRLNSKINPSELLSAVNRGIFNNLDKKMDSRYMTITALSLKPNGEVIYSGQHQDIYIYRAETKEIETLSTRGTWLGIFENIDEMLFDDIFTMNSEDCCILFTDGIIESRDEKKEMFSNEKLISVFKSNATKPLEVIKKNILKELDKYTCKDDITLVVFRKK